MANTTKAQEKKYYYESGKLEMIGNTINGKPEGEWKVYYESGKIKKNI